MTEKITVLYILGTGRCGSTMLEGILSSSTDMFATGELMALWDGRLQANAPCGCGHGLLECGFWNEVLGRVLNETVDPIDYMTMRRAVYGQAFDLARRRCTGDMRMHPALQRYANFTARLYKSIQDVSSARIIVDSSKASFYGLFLSTIPELDVRLVHLVRDPRGVAYSRTRRRLPAGATRREFTSQPSSFYLYWAFHWLTHNLVADALRLFNPRYIRVRYEDLVCHPERELERIRHHAGLSNAVVVQQDRTVRMRQNHTVAGNPVRFRTGDVPLRLDEEWKTALKPGYSTGISAIALPLMMRYGYPIWAP